MHGYTGAVDIVTDEIAQALVHGAQLSADDIIKLKERGYITTKSSKEEYNYAIEFMITKDVILHYIMPSSSIYPNCIFSSLNIQKRRFEVLS